MKFNKWIMAGAMAIGIAACSLFNSGAFDVCSAVQGVEIEQTAVVAAATTIIALNKTGVVPATTLAQATTAYNAWFQSQLLVITALTALNDAGGNPSAITEQQYQQALTQAIALGVDFIAVYNSLTTTPAAKLVLRPVRATPTTNCTLTDVQITSELTPPTWAALVGSLPTVRAKVCSTKVASAPVTAPSSAPTDSGTHVHIQLN